MFFKQFNKKEREVLYAIIGLFILFFLFRVLSNNFYLTDSYEYLDIAHKIRNFNLFDSNPPQTFSTKRPFVYPLFLSFFYNLPIIISVIFQTLVGVFTFFLIFKILNKFEIKIKKSYLWFFVFTPSIFIYTQLIMAEWLVMFFLTLLFWLLIQKWSPKNFAYIQVISLLLAFTKPIFYPILYINFIFFIIYFTKEKKFSFWIFFPLIVLQSYLTFNEVKTGYKHFSSIENINLINYNLYYFKSNTASETDADLWLDSIYNLEYEKKSFKDQNVYLRKVAKEEIKQHFFQYSFYHFYTSIRGLFDPGRYDLMTFFKKENGQQGFLEILNKRKSVWSLLNNSYSFVYLLLIPILLTILIKWFFFFKYIFTNKLDFKTYYILVVFMFYVLITGPVNSSRYIMPFQGVIITLAILGMSYKGKILK